MSACVEFNQVSKYFGDVHALDQVSVVCPGGAVTAIVGASGSGKTTMLAMVNGLVMPDAGEVRVFDQPVPHDGIEAFRHKIGYAVQGAGLFPHLTAFDNVTLMARLIGWGEGEMQARFQELLEEVDLPASVASRLPDELSGGQQQRIGLCRALMLRPDLLLLDEPFSAIDPITRSEIYQQFEKVKVTEPVSTLLVTHDLREARRLADYLIILSAGQIQQHGETLAVLDHPQSEYVERLVESQLD